MAGAPAVVLDERDAGCQLVVDLTHDWIAVLHLQVAEGYPRNRHKRRSLTGDGEGQGHSIAAAGIAQLRRHAQRTDCIPKQANCWSSEAGCEAVKPGQDGDPRTFARLDLFLSSQAAIRRQSSA